MMFKPNQNGFTLVELLIGMSITMVLVALAGGYLHSSWSTQSMIELESRLKTRSEQGLSKLSLELSQSKRLFSRGTNGTNYLDAMDLSTAPRPILSSQLPLVRSGGSMSPEKNCELSSSEYFLPYSVGNTLLFAEYRRTLKLSNGVPASTTYYRNIDVYRFNYVYISDYQNSSTANKSPTVFGQWSGGDLKYAQHLVEWHSVNVADNRQLTDLFADMNADGNSSEIARVAQWLAQNGVNVSWEPSENNLNNAFQLINATNGNLSSMRAAGRRLEKAFVEDVFRFGSDNSASIAYNTNGDKLQAGYFPMRKKVPYYYSPTLDSTLTCPQVTPVPSASPTGDYSFPRGFEVMVVGPQSGRSVLMHASLVGKGYSSRYVEQNHSLTTYAKDL